MNAGSATSPVDVISMCGDPHAGKARVRQLNFALDDHIAARHIQDCWRRFKARKVLKDEDDDTDDDDEFYYSAEELTDEMDMLAQAQCALKNDRANEAARITRAAIAHAERTERWRLAAEALTMGGRTRTVRHFGEMADLVRCDMDYSPDRPPALRLRQCGRHRCYSRRCSAACGASPNAQAYYNGI